MSNTISRAEFSFRIYNKDLFIFSIPEKMNDASGEVKEKFYNSKHKKISVACYIWNRKKTQNIEDFLKLKHFIWSLKSKSKKIKTFPADFHSWSKFSNPFPCFSKMKNFKLHHFFILNSKNIIYARLISTIR